MKAQRIIFLLAGLLIFALVLRQQDLGSVGRSLSAAGLGVVPFALFHAFPLATNTLGWSILLVAPGLGPTFPRFFLARWAGEAVNDLLPVGQVGGEILRSRLVSPMIDERTRAAASVVVDITLGLIAQIALGSVGLLFLVFTAVDGAPVHGLTLAAGIFFLMIVAFVVAQRLGIFGFGHRTARRVLRHLRLEVPQGHATGIDEQILGIYAQRWLILRAISLRTFGRLLVTIEIFLGLHILGAPAGLLESFILQSTTLLVTSLAFTIPGALGVQEGAFVFIGHMLGIDRDVALALALLIRAREFVLGIPVLIWYFAKGTTRGN